MSIPSDDHNPDDHNPEGHTPEGHTPEDGNLPKDRNLPEDGNLPEDRNLDAFLKDFSHAIRVMQNQLLKMGEPSLAEEIDQVTEEFNRRLGTVGDDPIVSHAPGKSGEPDTSDSNPDTSGENVIRLRRP